MGLALVLFKQPVIDALQPLRRLVPILWPDDDDPGRDHMDCIHDNPVNWAAINTPRIVTWPDAPAKGDAFDFFAMGGTVEQFKKLMAAARPFDIPDLASILDDIVDHNKQYLVLPAEALDTLALWDAHTGG